MENIAPFHAAVLLPRAGNLLSPGKEYMPQKASNVASTTSIDLDVKWEGFSRGLFVRGLFMIKATGTGDLFINTFGAIEQ